MKGTATCNFETESCDFHIVWQRTGENIESYLLGYGLSSSTLVQLFNDSHI